MFLCVCFLNVNLDSITLFAVSDVLALARLVAQLNRVEDQLRKTFDEDDDNETKFKVATDAGLTPDNNEVMKTALERLETELQQFYDTQKEFEEALKRALQMTIDAGITATMRGVVRLVQKYLRKVL